VNDFRPGLSVLALWGVAIFVAAVGLKETDSRSTQASGARESRPLATNTPPGANPGPLSWGWEETETEDDELAASGHRPLFARRSGTRLEEGERGSPHLAQDEGARPARGPPRRG